MHVTNQEEAQKPTIVDRVLDQMDDVFEAGPRSSLRRFMRLNPVDDWIISSDYVWGESTRPQDVAVFSILPNDVGLQKVVERIDSSIPSDFKWTREVGPRAVRFLRHRTSAFHVAFVLNKRSRIIQRPGSDALQTARTSIDMTLRRIEELQVGQYYVDRFSVLRRESLAGGFNVSLFNDILLIAAFYAFVVSAINGVRRPTRILWCSDRDDRTTWQSRILFDYAVLNAAFRTASSAKRLNPSQLPFLVLEGRGARDFDPLIRPPGFLAGALASWSLDRGVGTQGGAKYGTVLRDVVAGNPNIIVLHVDIQPGTIRTTRIRVRRAGA